MYMYVYIYAYVALTRYEPHPSDHGSSGVPTTTRHASPTQLLKADPAILSRDTRAQSQHNGLLAIAFPRRATGQAPRITTSPKLEYDSAPPRARMHKPQAGIR